MDYYPQGLPRNEEGIDVDSVDGETTDLSQATVSVLNFIYTFRAIVLGESGYCVDL